MVLILSLPRKFSTTIDIFFATRFFPFVYRKAGLLCWDLSPDLPPCMPETFCFSLVAGTEEEEKSGKAGAATGLGEPVNWVFEWYWPAAATAATNWIDRIKQNWEPNPPTICAQKVLKTSWPNRSSIQYPIPDRKPNLQKNCQYYMHCSVRTGHKSVSFFSLVLYSA